MIRRRAFLATATLLALGSAARAATRNEIAALESRFGGRLGVALLDTGSGERIEHRGDERFPLCSTFKFLAAAAVLDRVARGQERLDRRVRFTEADLLDYAPVARRHVADGWMAMGYICQAAIEVSDNTAGNLLLRELGGPSAITAYCRSLGDEVTRLDRIEPALNTVEPGDLRDTTSPAAMLGLMQATLLGSALPARGKERLETWLAGAKVGKSRLPAKLPEGWRIGHKTGSGTRGETNDIGIIRPPNRAPVLVAAYYADAPGSQEQKDAVLAEVGRLAAGAP